MPINVRKNNSELRLVQRSKFASVKLFASLIIQCIRFSFLVDQVKHSAFAAFMKANLPACLTGPFNAWPTLDTVTNAKVDFGGADLPPLQGVIITPSATLLLGIQWTPDLVPPGLPTDNVAALVYKQGSGGEKGKAYWTNLVPDPTTTESNNKIGQYWPNSIKFAFPRWRHCRCCCFCLQFDKISRWQRILFKVCVFPKHYFSIVFSTVPNYFPPAPIYIRAGFFYNLYDDNHRRPVELSYSSNIRWPSPS